MKKKIYLPVIQKLFSVKNNASTSPNPGKSISRSNLLRLVFVIVVIASGFFIGREEDDHKINISESDSIYIKGLFDSSFNLYRSNAALGIILGKKALELSKEKNWKFGEAQSRNSIGTNFYALGAFDSGSFEFHDAVLLYKQIDCDTGVASLLLNIGAVYNGIGNFEQALFYMDSSLSIYNKLGNSYKKAIILSNIGAVCYNLKKYDDAEKKGLEAIEIFKEVGREDAIAETLNNLANVAYVKGDYLSAIEKYKQVEMMYASKKAGMYLPTVFINKGLIYLNSPDSLLAKWDIDPKYRFDSSLALFNKAKLGADTNNDRVVIADYNNAMGDFMEKKGDYKAANTFIKEAKKINDSIQNQIMQGKMAQTVIDMKYEVYKIQEKKDADTKATIKANEELSGTRASVFSFIGLSIFAVLLFTILIRLKISKSHLRAIGLVGTICLTEAIQFAIHFYTHHFITESPWLVLAILILVAIFVISPLHESIMHFLEEKIEKNKAYKKKPLKRIRTDRIKRLIPGLSKLKKKW